MRNRCSRLLLMTQLQATRHWLEKKGAASADVQSIELSQLEWQPFFNIHRPVHFLPVRPVSQSQSQSNNNEHRKLSLWHHLLLLYREITEGLRAAATTFHCPGASLVEQWYSVSFHQFSSCVLATTTRIGKIIKINFLQNYLLLHLRTTPRQSPSPRSFVLVLVLSSLPKATGAFLN